MSRASSRTVMPSEVLLDGFVGYLRSERGVVGTDHRRLRH